MCWWIEETDVTYLVISEVLKLWVLWKYVDYLITVRRGRRTKSNWARKVRYMYTWICQPCPWVGEVAWLREERKRWHWRKIADGTGGRAGIRGSLRGPRGPKNTKVRSVPDGSDKEMRKASNVLSPFSLWGALNNVESWSPLSLSISAHQKSSPPLLSNHQ